MKKIIITGGNGLVGSRIVELLKDRYSFLNFSRATGFDVTNKDSIMHAISTTDAEIVFHLAGYTNVKQAEKEKDLKEQSEAWKINVAGTEYVAKACEQTGKKMVYVSTDMVLGGDTPPEKGYREEAEPNPLCWYAQTKYEGELRVKQIKTPWIIMRIAYPYRASFIKPDFVRFFLNWLKEEKPIDVLTDRMITPTFIDDLAGAFDTLISQQQTGTYHAVGSQTVSIYEAVQKIADCFILNKSLIGKTTRAEFLIQRPPEPFSSALNNDKIEKLGVKMKTFEEGLLEVKKQMSQ